MKLKALAAFADRFGDAFHRIEALTKVDGQMRVIDMKAVATRGAVKVATQSAAEIYRSSIAEDYDVG